MTAEKVWFITGCSTGLGRAIAKEALLSGAKVAITARNVESIADLAKSYPANALLLPLDVTNQAEIDSAVAATKNKFGRIDVLVNNAGSGVIGAIEEVPEEEARKIFEINFFGLFNVTRTVLPIMRAQKSGYIINIACLGGLVATFGLGIYNATKFAVEGLSEALAQEIEPLGIKITLIEPGPLRTDFTTRSSMQTFSHIKDYDQTRGVLCNIIDQYNKKQPGDPQKAAQVIVQLANNPVPPLHLPMGKFALERIREKISELSDTISTWEKISTDTEFTD